jgi:hypothetical protein
MATSYDSDRPDGKRLPAVAPPPRKVGAPAGPLPDLQVIAGAVARPLPPVSVPPPRGGSTPGPASVMLPPVSLPPRRTDAGAVAELPVRDPLAESVTHVRMEGGRTSLGVPHASDTEGPTDDWTTSHDASAPPVPSRAEPSIRPPRSHERSSSSGWGGESSGGAWSRDDEDSTALIADPEVEDPAARALYEAASRARAGVRTVPTPAPSDATLTRPMPSSDEGTGFTRPMPSANGRPSTHAGYLVPAAPSDPTAITRTAPLMPGPPPDPYAFDGAEPARGSTPVARGSERPQTSGFRSPRFEAEPSYEPLGRAPDAPRSSHPAYDPRVDALDASDPGLAAFPSAGGASGRGFREERSADPYEGTPYERGAALHPAASRRGSSAPPDDPYGNDGRSRSFPPPPRVPFVQGRPSARVNLDAMLASSPSGRGDYDLAPPLAREPTGGFDRTFDFARPRAAPSLPPLAGPEAAPNRTILALGGAAALSVILALAGFVFSRRPGGLEIDARDASGGSLAKAEVYVDGRKVCDATPCIVRDLDAGPHTVRVLSANMGLDPVTAEVKSGSIERLLLAAKAAAATLVVGGSQPNVRVFVDGVDRGSLPVRLDDLAAGTRQIRLAGDRYKPIERTVEVKPGDTVDLGTTTLEVTRGRVVVDVKDDGVRVLLVRNGDRAHAKTLDGPFPRPIEVETSSGSWKLIATKTGAADFVAPLDFSDGIPERALVVSMGGASAVPTAPAASTETAAPSAPVAAPVATPAAPTPVAPPPAPREPTPREPTAREEPVAKASSGTGTLNINSIPASRVLLDGQPMGETPRTGVQVSAGTHTVTFIHPELGKKSISVKVGAGETKAATARLRKD